MSNNELYEDEDGTARAHVCRDAERRWVVETNLADTGGLSQYGFAVALTRGAAIAQSIATRRPSGRPRVQTLGCECRKDWCARSGGAENLAGSAPVCGQLAKGIGPWSEIPVRTKSGLGQTSRNRGRRIPGCCSRIQPRPARHSQGSEAQEHDEQVEWLVTDSGPRTVGEIPWQRRQRRAKRVGLHAS